MEKPTSTENQRQGGIGRTNFISEEEKPDQKARDEGKGRDMSTVDQQEGEMNNGVIGGSHEKMSPGPGHRQEWTDDLYSLF